MVSRGKEYAAWILLVSAVTLLTVGDFDIRLADAQYDDHFAVFANWLTRPELFLKDPIRHYGPSYLSTSIVNWGPAFLLGVLPIGWKTVAVALVLLQNLLIFFALRTYAFVFTHTGWKANFVAFAIFAAGWWRVNLAMFPGVSHTPYPGTMVLPLILFTTVALLQKRVRVSAVWFGVCFLVHPALALIYFPIWLAGAWLFARQKLHVIAGLASVAIGMIPTAVVQLWRGPGISSNGQLATMLNNWHMVPWNHASFWHWDLPSYSGWTALFVISVVKTRAIRRKQLLFFSFSLAALVGFAAMNILGAEWGIPAFLQLVPLRASQIFLLLIQPVALLYLVEILEAGEKEMQIAATLFLGLQAYSGMGFLWPVLILFWRGDRGRNGRIALAVYLLAVLLVGRPLSALGYESISNMLRAWLWPGGNYSFRAFVVVVAVAILMYRASLRWTVLTLPRMALVGLVVIAFIHAWNLSARTRDPRVQDYYAAQRWAKRETAPGTVFVVPEESWRGVSQRPALYLHPPPFEVYVKSRGYRQLASEIREQGHEPRERWDRDAVIRFARQFGGDYWVRDARYPLALSEAYRNGSYIIYSLHNL